MPCPRCSPRAARGWTSASGAGNSPRTKAWRATKLQAPNTKLQENSKPQAPCGRARLALEVWCLLEAWGLALGTSTSLREGFVRRWIERRTDPIAGFIGRWKRRQAQGKHTTLRRTAGQLQLRAQVIGQLLAQGKTDARTAVFGRATRHEQRRVRRKAAALVPYFAAAFRAVANQGERHRAAARCGLGGVFAKVNQNERGQVGDAIRQRTLGLHRRREAHAPFQRERLDAEANHLLQLRQRHFVSRARLIFAQH